MKPAKSSFLVFALLASGISLGFAPVRADDLPADTNTIESLTPEQARKLAREFPGVVMDVEIHDLLTQTAPCLPLNGLKSLDAKTAKALAGFTGPLLLNGLTTLDAQTAKALAEFKGQWLHLNSLRTLDPDTAMALVKFRGHTLYLSGLRTLDAATAKAIAGFKGTQLSFEGLTALDADTAQALASFKGNCVFLSGLTTRDADTAKVLAAARIFVTDEEQAAGRRAQSLRPAR